MPSISTQNTKRFSAVMSKAICLLYLVSKSNLEKCLTGCHDLPIDSYLNGKISKCLILKDEILMISEYKFQHVFVQWSPLFIWGYSIFIKDRLGLSRLLKKNKTPQNKDATLWVK